MMRTNRGQGESWGRLFCFFCSPSRTLLDTRYTIKSSFHTVTTSRLFPSIRLLWCQTSNKFHTSCELLKLVNCHVSSRQFFPHRLLVHNRKHQWRQVNTGGFLGRISTPSTCTLRTCDWTPTDYDGKTFPFPMHECGQYCMSHRIWSSLRTLSFTVLYHDEAKVFFKI